MKTKNRFIRVILGLIGGLLALILLALLVLWIIPLTETGDPSTVEGSADWMAGLDDELPLSSIVLPGTHDSATKYVQLAFFSKCQSMDIAAQLDAGYRYLDIRLAAEGEGMKLMHGFTSCKTGPLPWSRDLTLADVLQECYAFLDAHPGETIVFAVKQEHGTETTEEFQRILNAIIQKDPSRWLLTDRIPLLGDARGKLVLMRRYEDDAHLAEAAGIPLVWENQNGPADAGLSISMSEQENYRLWVQDRYEYDAEEKWSAFLSGLREPGIQDGDLSIHFLSTKGSFAYGHPFSFARKLNPRMAELPDNEFSGWIIADFASSPLAEHIYLSNHS